MKDLTGSQIAKNGFANEKDVAEKFNNWNTDEDAKLWLKIMKYQLEKIEYVKAFVIHGHKSDVNIQIKIKLKQELNVENIQIKLVSNKSGFNQIDKRWLKNYNELWHFSPDVYKILQYFTGEILPYKENTKDSRRMFFYEMEENERSCVYNWISEHKLLIISDIIRGRGEFSAEWVLVVQKLEKQTKWILKNINEVMQCYANGDIVFSPRGSINIGKILVQRKGGDNGKETANMLQFKINPIELFNN